MTLKNYENFNTYTENSILKSTYWDTDQRCTK